MACIPARLHEAPPSTPAPHGRLAGIGFGIGLGFSIATTYLLRWLRWRGAKPYIETTVVLAVAYLSFYVTNSPAKVR